MEYTVNLYQHWKRFIKITAQFIFGLSGLITLQAHAATCESYDPTYFRDITIPIIGTGMATVGEELPIGTVIYGQGYKPEVTRIGYKCTWTASEAPATVKAYNKVQVISMPSGAPTVDGVKSIFPTNVPGIGVAVFMPNGIYGGNGEYPKIWEKDPKVVNTSSGTSASESSSNITIQLIKTGPIAPGTQQVLASSFPVLQASTGTTSPAAFEYAFWRVRFSGVINFYTSTCQAEDVDVDLGSHRPSDFPSVGSTSEWTNFDITLRNCPPFYGYQQATMNFMYTEGVGMSGNGYMNPNKLGVVFNSVHGYTGTTVANIESGADSAEGIGIQLADRVSSFGLNISGSTTYDAVTKFGNPLPVVDGQNYIIPLRARYYRVGTPMKPGKANGAITYTINYH